MAFGELLNKAALLVLSTAFLGSTRLLVHTKAVSHKKQSETFPEKTLVLINGVNRESGQRRESGRRRNSDRSSKRGVGHSYSRISMIYSRWFSCSGKNNIFRTREGRRCSSTENLN